MDRLGEGNRYGRVGRQLGRAGCRGARRDCWRRSVLGARPEHHIDPVVAGVKTGGGEPAAAAVPVKPVGAVFAVRQCAERCAVNPCCEVGAVDGVPAVGCVVGGDVGGVGGDGDGRGEVDLLPAGRGLTGERGGGEQRAGARPQFAHVRARVTRALVEPHTRDVTRRRRAELYTQLDRRRVVRRCHSRSHRIAPDGRPSNLARGSERPRRRARQRISDEVANTTGGQRVCGRWLQIGERMDHDRLRRVVVRRRRRERVPSWVLKCERRRGELDRLAKRDRRVYTGRHIGRACGRGACGDDGKGSIDHDRNCRGTGVPSGVARDGGDYVGTTRQPGRVPYGPVRRGRYFGTDVRSVYLELNADDADRVRRGRRQHNRPPNRRVGREPGERD